MLISKRSPEPERTPAATAEFPLRRYLRRREELTVGSAHALLLAALAVLVLLLGRAMDVLCRTPAGRGGVWVRTAVWLATAILALSVGRVLYYKLMELRQIRREMAALRAAFRPAGDDDGPHGQGGRHRS
jgi:hypothetical protein